MKAFKQYILRTCPDSWIVLLRKGFGRWNELRGIKNEQWARVVMNRTVAEHMRSLDYKNYEVLEISGTGWSSFGFKTYQSLDYEQMDICELKLDRQFDLIFVEQVLEHVLWPHRAVKNLFAMLRPSGILVVTTPFLIKIHNYPHDCSRWTEIGIKHLLVEGGFEPSRIITGSWGNRECVVANLDGWVLWNPKKHSLRNDPDFPVVVWAIARK